jgi:hypothetical protein
MSAFIVFSSFVISKFSACPDAASVRERTERQPKDISVDRVKDNMTLAV